MTQPDGLFPAGAFNIDSLAELAARPQSEWEAQMRGQTSAGFEVILSSLFGPLPADLQEGIEFTRAVITAIIRQILNLPGQIWDSLDDAFAQLGDWAQNIPGLSQFLDLLNTIFGPLFGGVDLSNPLDPAAVWHTVVTAFMLPLNLLLGPNSPLNLANAFGRLSLPQFGGGVPLSFLTTAVPNLLEPFSPTSVPTADGWSFDAAADAAKVICDGTTKTLYLNSSVIKVEPDQPLNTLIKVKYSGVSSTAVQSIRYVLDTFTSADGSGPSTPVVIGSIANPSGTITSPVSLGNASWAIPAGVQSVRPVLVTDALSAGTVFWLNTPLLEIPLQGVLAGGLPAALNNLGDWIESLVDQLLSALGVVGSGSLLDKIFDLADEFGGWLLDTQGVSANLDDLLGNLLSNPGSVIGTLPQSLITGLTSKLQFLTSGGLFDASQLTNILNIPAIAQGSVTGLTGALGSLQTTLNQLGDIFNGVVVTPVNSIVQAVKDWWPVFTGKTQNITSGGLFDATKITGTVPAAIVGGVAGAANIGDAVQQAIDTVVKAAGDIVGSGFGLDDLLGSVMGVRGSATGANEYVIDLQSQLVENSIGGISTVVKFSEYADASSPPSIFTKVSDTGSGSIVTSGGQVMWSGSAGKELYLYNVESLQSDLFEVSFVMPTAPTHGPFGVDGNNFIYPIGRANSTGTAYCIAEIGWKSARIGCVVSGTTTWFSSVDWHGASYEIPSGALVKFKGGTIENGRYFQVFVNNRRVLSATDGSSVSQLGSSYRWCGLGMQKDSSYSPGSVSVWSQVDGNLGVATGTVTGFNNGVLASLKLWTGTEAQYAAVGTKDSSTVYVVMP